MIKIFKKHTLLPLIKRKYITWFFGFFVGIPLAGISLFIMAALGVFGKMPTFEALENPKTNLATEILSSDGMTLGKIYLNDNRTPINHENLSEELVNALISAEDERFYSHSGIDIKGTIRAIVYLGRKGGGSTITQQLARQLFVGVRSKNVGKAMIQKIKEWIIAIMLEKNYTKEEIISMYFNTYDFGNQADGIRSAARIYFGKEPKDLSIAQAATLVGMFKNSSLYNPRRNPEGVLNRRNVVLYQMYKKNFLDKIEKDSLQKLSLGIKFHSESHDRGIATYFREYVRSFLKGWARKNKKQDGSKYNLYSDGLKVYSTINYEMQQKAEEAVSEHMKKLQKEFFAQNLENPTAPFIDLTDEETEQTIHRAKRQSERWRYLKYNLGLSDEEIDSTFYKPKPMRVFTWESEKDTVMTPLDSIFYYKHFLRCGLLSLEPQTGHVKAWVGGVNYKYFKYDHVIQGARQTGSTFKPFVYASAIDQLRISPCDSLPEVLYCIKAKKYGNTEAWCPRNSGEKYSGEMKTLKEALANSINTITATVMDKVGPQPVVSLVKKLGITSYIPKVPSIALGTADVKLYEMVAAYGSFVNKGIYIKPTFITRIEDKKGVTVYEAVPETKDVLNEEIAYTVISLMKGVTESGSGQRLRGNSKENQLLYKNIITGYPYEFTNPISGKTGTTQNNSDAWFVGMVPNLATGIWVGGEDRSIHFESTAYGQGASMALPIWALYMKKCYEVESLNISYEDFEKPQKISININCGESEKILLSEKEKNLEETDSAFTKEKKQPFKDLEF